MINILSTLAFFLLLPGGNVFAQKVNAAIPGDTSQSMVYDFGTAKKDAVSARVFKIYNNSNAAVRIRSISATPYCNVPVWSTRPIKPGRYGLIKVTYNGAEVGPFEAELRIIYYDQETLPSENIIEEVVVKGVVND